MIFTPFDRSWSTTRTSTSPEMGFPKRGRPGLIHTTWFPSFRSARAASMPRYPGPYTTVVSERIARSRTRWASPRELRNRNEPGAPIRESGRIGFPPVATHRKLYVSSVPSEKATRFFAASTRRARFPPGERYPELRELLSLRVGDPGELPLPGNQVGQHRPEVRGNVLLRRDDDLGVRVLLPRGLGGGEAGGAASQDEVAHGGPPWWDSDTESTIWEFEGQKEKEVSG